MHQFEFILIITSVIYAMSIAQIMSGASRLVQTDARVRWYLPHTLWIAVVFLLILMVWWSTWEFRDIDWSFPDYIYMAVPPTLLFFTASLLIPGNVFGEVVDLEKHFERIRKPFLWTFLVAVAAAVADGTILRDEPLWFPGRASHVALLLTVTAGIVTHRKAAHVAVAAATLLALVYIVVVRLWLPR